MNCPHVQNLISAFIDCELDVEEKRELRQHLFYCPECSAGYQELLEIKECLQNLTAVSLHFDPLQDLHLRLSAEQHSLVRQVGKFFWLGRVGLVTACLTAFFLSSYFLFPAKPMGTSNLATNNTIRTQPQIKAFEVPATSPKTNSASYDQDFSIDQPVNVYQASFVFP
jgi:predicted anti-sigma-YlaC factor YlaD